MSKTITVNFLGDTVEEQWSNAVDIYRTALESNISGVRRTNWSTCDDHAADVDRMLDAMERVLDSFAEEMHRLVGIAFGEEG